MNTPIPESEAAAYAREGQMFDDQQEMSGYPDMSPNEELESADPSVPAESIEDVEAALKAVEQAMLVADESVSAAADGLLEKGFGSDPLVDDEAAVVTGAIVEEVVTEQEFEDAGFDDEPVAEAEPFDDFSPQEEA